jgi:hypothetical protein
MAFSYLLNFVLSFKLEARIVFALHALSLPIYHAGACWSYWPVEEL